MKYCSSFYIPFRQVVGSCTSSNFIDKRGSYKWQWRIIGDVNVLYHLDLMCRQSDQNIETGAQGQQLSSYNSQKVLRILTVIEVCYISDVGYW